MTDKLRDGEVSYFVKRDEGLPTIPTPPAGAVKMAFFTAIRYRSIASAIKAYNSAVTELAYTQQAFTMQKEATLDHHRAIRKLEDAETIHRADGEAREAKRLKAEAERIRAQQEVAELNHLVRLRERERAKELNPHQSPAELSEEEKEFADNLKAKASPARFRQIAEGIIDEYKSKRGKLTEADERHIQDIRDACEESIRDIA